MPKFELLPPLVWIGIDPGKSGGIAVMVAPDALKCVHRIELFKMPETEIDLLKFFQDQKVQKNRSIQACVEIVGGYTGEGQPGSAMFNFGRAYGAVRMACLSQGIPLEEVSPRTWQAAIGVSVKKKEETKTQHKKKIREVVQRLYPNVNIPNIQVADSLGIAEYYRRKCLGLLQR